MKLRNKKTGELATLVENEDCLTLETDAGFHHYLSLAELNKEWEDYKESETFYIVEHRGEVGSRFRVGGEYEKKFKEIGNYFETREEAEKIVEKLKAWKRLKDNGFKFDGWKRDERFCGDFTITATDQTSCDDKDLDLLFGE